MIKGAEAKLIIQETEGEPGYDMWIEAQMGSKQLQVQFKPADLDWFQRNMNPDIMPQKLMLV